MRVEALFRLPTGESATLGHGELIGRLWSARLQLDDPRVSEAHAMVSLRGGELRLVGLRGRIGVGGHWLGEVELTPGLVVSLAPGLDLTVEDVTLPEAVLALEGDGLARQVLHSACSLVLRPRPSLEPSVHPAAAAVIWSSGLGFTLRLGSEPPRPLLPGDAFTVEGRTFRAVAVPTVASITDATAASRLAGPLRIVARYDTVHIARDGETVVITGLSARILSELIAAGRPMSWEALAGELWGHDEGRDSLRRKLDVAMFRLRDRLRRARVRPDLVRASGTGVFEVVLHPRDVTVDEV